MTSGIALDHRRAVPRRFRRPKSEHDHPVGHLHGPRLMCVLDEEDGQPRVDPRIERGGTVRRARPPSLVIQAIRAGLVHEAISSLGAAGPGPAPAPPA